MTTRNYTQEIVSPAGLLKRVTYSLVSSNSPRVGGRLLFKQNSLNFYRTNDNYGDFVVTTHYGKDPSEVEHLTAYNVTGGSRRVYFDSSEATYKATNRYYNELRSVSTNLAELYATRKETESLVLSNMKRIAAAYSALRRGNIGAMGRALGRNLRKPISTRPTQAWLEYVYAWKPLVQDVYGLLNVEFKEPYRIVKGRAKTQGRIASNSATNTTFQYVGFIDYSCSVTIRAKATASGSSLGPCSEFGVTNPALLGWELLPFSFVVDWFLPVGPYLDRLLTPVSDVNISDFSITTKNTSVWNCHAFVFNGNRPPTANGYKTSPGANFTCETHSVNRSLSIPSVPFPRLQNPLSPTHFANAMSLLVSAFRGH